MVKAAKVELVNYERAAATSPPSSRRRGGGQGRLRGRGRAAEKVGETVASTSFRRIRTSTPSCRSAARPQNAGSSARTSEV
jgi:hypothetical protein